VIWLGFLQDNRNSLILGTLDFWRIIVSMEDSKKTMKVLGRIQMRKITKKNVKILGFMKIKLQVVKTGILMM